MNSMKKTIIGLVMIFMCSSLVAQTSKTLEITQGDTVIIRLEQVTHMINDLPLPDGETLLYTLTATHTDGQFEYLGGINRITMNYSPGEIKSIGVNTGINDKIGSYIIEGFTERVLSGGLIESDVARLTLTVNEKKDTTKPKKWIIDFVLQ